MVVLEEWLQSCGCGSYIEAFRDSGVTADLLGELSSEDLKELGLSLGDRKRFMRAAAQLPGEPTQGTGVQGQSPEAVDQTHAERRRLTVMFVDLIGSTALSSRLDPEEMSEVIHSYQDAVAGVVTRFEGHIAQYLGDGVLCYFGWPRALEDAAERAVGAGLAIKDAVAKVTACSEPLTCRVGIATGLVVVGEMTVGGISHENTAIGDTPNFAARLQGYAKAGQVVISESTKQLLGAAFTIEPLGARSFKGLPGQHKVYAVLGGDPAHDRFLARAGQSVGTMIGRDHELAMLMDRWSLSKDGEGQGIILTGEAGIGKSRICRALSDKLSRDDYFRVRYQCSPYYRDTAFWPAIHQLIEASGIAQVETNDEKLDRLEELLLQAGQIDNTSFAIFGELLGLDTVKRYGPVNLSPSAKRAATFTALVDQVVGLSSQKPVLVLVEDAHWCDPTTVELINLLIDRIATERIMLLITCRHEKKPEFPSFSHFTTLALNRLGRSGVEEIVAHLGGDKLPQSTISAIIERTDGVPLFVEELTKALIESGNMSVPASLHDTLMARLDRLPEVKNIAQIASVVGREFDSDPLAQVAVLSQQKVATALENLRRVELVFPRGSTGHYIFKHALVRDAAYESILNRRRQEIHGRIFDVLLENEQTMPGVLANHAAEAGRLKEAVKYGRLAAEEALRRPAYAEAITHLESALGVLAMQEPSEEVQRERIQLLLLTGQARIAHYGYAAQSTVDTYAEIEQIAREIGDKELLIEGLYGRWAGHYVPGRNPVALEVADKIHEASEKVEDQLARALGHRLRGTVLTMMGRVDDATTALSAVNEHYNPELHASFASRFGQDVGIARDCYMTGVLTLSGRFDSAAEMAQKILRDLDEVNHAHTTGYALGHLACFLCAAEIEPLGIEIAGKCIEIGERDRMPLWAALGHASISMAKVNEGHDAEAIPEFSNALDMLSELDFGVFRTILLPAHALALARTGNFTAAAAHLAEARGLMEENDARFSEPELSRVEGQLAVLQRNNIKAKSCFEHAIGRAQNLGHLSWELRATEDLAAMLRWEEDFDQAREILETTHAKFHEGHGFPLLQRVALAIKENA